MRIFKTIDELAQAVGQELGASDWVSVTQEMIDRFADATGDHQWIHVDRVRAARELPQGRTIAHGFLTLSLLAQLRDQIYDVGGVASRLNYGCDKVRFLEPVPSGSRVRLRLTLAKVEPSRHGVRVDSACAMELEGAPRPALVADHIVLLIPA
jgi:acyl dehydratase